MIHPTHGKDNYKYRIFGKIYKEGYHRGQDIGCNEGTNVYASYDGEVIKSGFFQGYGSLNPSRPGGAIWIKHVDKTRKVFYTHYGHVKPLVVVGDVIKADTIIGQVSRFYNGNDRLPHLHYSRFNGEIIPKDCWGYGND